MYKKKILLSSLLFVAPFFAKGGADSTKTSALERNDIRRTCLGVFDFQYDFDCLLSDHPDFFAEVKFFDVKLNLMQEFGYELPDNDFIITSHEDNSVQYMRPDNSGFIRKSGSRTWRNQNPGAIRVSPFIKKMGAIGEAGGFAVFPNEETGMIALKKLLKSDGYANLTIYDAIHKYAPFCDNNNPVNYQRHLYNKTGIDVNRRLCDLSDDELDKIAEVIKVLEGWKTGVLESIGPVADALEEIRNNQKQYNS